MTRTQEHPRHETVAARLRAVVTGEALQSERARWAHRVVSGGVWALAWWYVVAASPQLVAPELWPSSPELFSDMAVLPAVAVLATVVRLKSRSWLHTGAVLVALLGVLLSLWWFLALPEGPVGAQVAAH